MTNSLLLTIAIEIVVLPIEKHDFAKQTVSLPEEDGEEEEEQLTQNLVAHGPNCSYSGTLSQSKIAILGYQLGIDSVSVIPGANLPNQVK